VRGSIASKCAVGLPDLAGRTTGRIARDASARGLSDYENTEYHTLNRNRVTLRQWTRRANRFRKQEMSVSAASGPAHDAPESQSALQSRTRMRSRFCVHLALLATFAASLATVTLITEGWPHLAVGLAFFGLAIVHVAQRRHTAARLARNIGQVRVWIARRGRLAWSDLVLSLLTLNVLASGTYDLITGNQVILHPRALGIPFRDIGWHVSAALLLLAYLCLHVGRRWGRLRRSVVR